VLMLIALVMGRMQGWKTLKSCWKLEFVLPWTHQLRASVKKPARTYCRHW